MNRYQKVLYSAIAFGAVLFSIAFAFSQYLGVREHNLNVKREIRSCFLSSAETFEDANLANDFCKPIKESFIWE